MDNVNTDDIMEQPVNPNCKIYSIHFDANQYGGVIISATKLEYKDDGTAVFYSAKSECDVTEIIAVFREFKYITCPELI